MPEYATLQTVKDYLSIPQDFTQFDGKLNIILAGVNSRIENLTNQTESNPDLTLAACKWTEWHYIKATGVSSEDDSDYRRSFFKTRDYIPPEVLSLLEDYLTDEAKEKYVKSRAIKFQEVKAY
ncbi:hypothetical protein BBF96_03495 [Anoxybacter fermentans]|uniref:Uncharacterized protein n=1 Tax=Anoxybacter fermentans TaxID=1323375 RepID=A0A3S9SW24_9FIRM|nr:hypothetical protein [Anoxybacter fermentans]AZR72527.1 hypothetical protein BBF96_03495 [Anoxybacter fermentans]